MKVISIKYISVLLFSVLVCFCPLCLKAQRMISGTITDAVTGEALPYIAVTLKKNLLSVATNENGIFDFNIPEEVKDDSMMISSIGYATQAFALASVQSPIAIKLKPNSFELKEVMILPMAPEYYIKQAMNAVKINYPSKPFGTEAYYREKMTENDNIVKFTEAVFNTYYPNYTDTAQKNQHQLLLYNKADDKKIQFMNDENRKKKKKKNETAGADTSKGPAIDITEIIGGPEEVLKLDIIRGEEDFLDSSEFRWYRYEFAASSSYDNKELMVINFESRRRINNVKKAGKIYIDLVSNAIVSIDYTGDLMLPTIIQPILFVMGIHIERPEIRKKLEYQQIDGKWFPKNIQGSADINLTKHHWFSDNEHSHLLIDGIFTVNKMITENAKPVAESKQYTPKKKMEEQVHNDNHLTWDQINVIKR
jgi:hypothetical protein